MDNCLNSIHYSGHKFQFDRCYNVISFQVEHYSEKFTRDSLIELSKSCFDLYKHRLSNISSIIHEIGTEEYNLINDELINLILPFDPLKFSFSITEDPSLHFFVRFSNQISLFIETYLDIIEGNDTYVQLTKTDNSIYEKNCMFDDAIIEINNLLFKEFPSSTKTYYNFSKAFNKCSPSL